MPSRGSTSQRCSALPGGAAAFLRENAVVGIGRLDATDNQRLGLAVEGRYDVNLAFVVDVLRLAVVLAEELAGGERGADGDLAAAVGFVEMHGRLSARRALGLGGL